jgi:hypothetical protein
MKSIQPLCPFLHRSQFIPFSFFMLPLKVKASLLGISIGELPGPSEHIPGFSARFSTMSSGYFS